MMVKKSRLLDNVLLVFMIVLAVVYCIPLVMMFLGSVKPQWQAVLFDLSWPVSWNWSNYTHVIIYGSIFRGYFNSIVITSLTTCVVVLIGSTAGIIITRRNNIVVQSIYYYFLFGLTITLQVASSFLLLKTLNIYGGFLGVICIFIAQHIPFTIMTFSSFVKGVPKEIDEAAIVDGCGSIRLIRSILLPIMKPMVITNIIIIAITVWNNFMIPLFYISTPSKAPIPLSVYNFFGMYVRDWQYVFANLVLTILPVLILFLCLQKQIIAGMVSGSVKG